MSTSSRTVAQSSLPFLALILCVVLIPTTGSAKKGFYFGFGVGYGSVSGDTGIGLQNQAKDPDSYAGSDLDELIRTDAGSGVAINFRLGYNILGVVAIEAEFGGSGANISDGDEVEGQAGVFLLVKVFPFQFFDQFKNRFWDPYLFGGGGVYFMGYHPDAHPPYEMTNDGRAWWPSSAAKFGLGCDFYVSPFLSLGIDLAFISGFHSNYYIDYDDDITTEAKDTASSFAFQPTIKATFHFLTQ